MKLVVFDLDQTLVDLIPVHDRATEELFKRNYGRAARLTEIDFAGRSMADNLVQLGIVKGMPEDRMRADVQRLLSEYDAIFGGMVPGDAWRHVLPGAVELLDLLSSRPHIVALYTGSSRAVGEAVLRATGLLPHFRFCFYGTEFSARSEMLVKAMEATSSVAGHSLEGQDVVVVGDSVRDVEAARAVGAVAIVVATGFASRETLGQAGPDCLFDDLRDTRAVMEAIESCRCRREVMPC